MGGKGDERQEDKGQHVAMASRLAPVSRYWSRWQSIVVVPDVFRLKFVHVCRCLLSRMLSVIRFVSRLLLTTPIFPVCSGHIFPWATSNPVTCFSTSLTSSSISYHVIQARASDNAAFLAAFFMIPGFPFTVRIIRIEEMTQSHLSISDPHRQSAACERRL